MSSALFVNSQFGSFHGSKSIVAGDKCKVLSLGTWLSGHPRRYDLVKRSHTHSKCWAVGARSAREVGAGYAVRIVRRLLASDKQTGSYLTQYKRAPLLE